MKTSPSRYPLTTTLNRIWECGPCKAGRARALAATGKTAPDDEPITYAAIVDAMGLEDALWCTQAEPQYSREWRLFAVWCARRVQHLMDDRRSLAAIDAAERFADGSATRAELDAAARNALDVAAAAPRTACRTHPRRAHDAWATVYGSWAAYMATSVDATDAALYAAQYYSQAAVQDAARTTISADVAIANAKAAQQIAFLQVVTHG